MPPMTAPGLNALREPAVEKDSVTSRSAGCAPAAANPPSARIPSEDRDGSCRRSLSVPAKSGWVREFSPHGGRTKDTDCARAAGTPPIITTTINQAHLQLCVIAILSCSVWSCVVSLPLLFRHPLEAHQPPVPVAKPEMGGDRDLPGRVRPADRAQLHLNECAVGVWKAVGNLERRRSS